MAAAEQIWAQITASNTGLAVALKEQQELIQEEAAQNDARGDEQVPNDRDDIDEAEEEVKKQENAMAASDAADKKAEEAKKA